MPAFRTRHFLIWSVICSVSAAPSFFFALIAGYNSFAIITGIIIFASFYTIFSSSQIFSNLKQKKIIRRSFKFGAGSRIIASVILIIGLIISRDSFIILFGAMDTFPGMLAITITNNIFGVKASPPINVDIYNGFLITFVTTIIHAIFLNIIMYLIMGLAALAQIIWLKFFSKKQNIS